MTPLLSRLTPAHALPFFTASAEVSSAALPGAGLVISAAPGSGKTTLLPVILSDACHGRIIVTQPRRIAARAGARRIASLLGQECGSTVAYTVKGDSTLREQTRIEFVTPAVLLRRLQNDPELAGVGAIIFDEYHERHLDTDLTLACALDVRQTLREDLVIAITSATVDTGAAADLFQRADITPEIINVEVDSYPLTTQWVPLPERAQAIEAAPWGGLRVSRAFLVHIACVCERAVDEYEGDCLVFLPGVGEVNAVVDLLRSRCPTIDVMALHGSLSAREQDRVLSGSDGRRRIVVSTALAESSVTVPGVRIVVDGGLSREPRVDAASGIGGLTTVPASRASCIQRGGRAAREAAGVVFRVGDEVSWARRTAYTLPEMMVTDLTWALLQSCVWGATDFSSLLLADYPPTGALGAARERLQALGALDEEGNATSLGRLLSRFPLSPGLARAVLIGEALFGREKACRGVALLSHQWRPAGADLSSAVRGFSSGRVGDEVRAEVREATRRLTTLLDSLSASDRSAIATQISPSLLQCVSDVHSENDVIASLSALAYPHWLAKARGNGSRQFLSVSGGGMELDEHSPLIGEEWLTVSEVTRQSGQSGARIRSALPLTSDVACAVAEGAIHSRRDVSLVQGRVSVTSLEMLGAIVLKTASSRQASIRETVEALMDLLHRSGVEALPWSDESRQLRARLSALHDVFGEPWPDVSDDALRDSVEQWLDPECSALARGVSLASWNLSEALRRLFPWPEGVRFEELAPSRVEVPVGGTREVDWSSGRPVVSLRVQEAFGWLTTPTWADGREKILIHLLDPARRPVAVTSDLASFWGEPYRQVRAQLRGRYPKHPWPEDPLTYEPTSRAKPRKK